MPENVSDTCEKHVTGHVFLHCLSLAVWWGPQWCALLTVWPLLCQNRLQMCGFKLLLLICLLCPTSMLVTTVVVVQRSTVGLSSLPFCRQSSACSAGDTVAGDPVCSSLSSLANVLSRSAGPSCQCQHGPASQHWEVCAATPQLSPEGGLIRLSL